jgi:hypothetical protein
MGLSWFGVASTERMSVADRLDVGGGHVDGDLLEAASAVLAEGVEAEPVID